MSSEIAVAGIATGHTVVCKIRRDPTETIWSVSGSAFETYTDPHSTLGNYDILLTEQGTSGYYVGNFPTGITAAGTYELTFYSRSGTTPTFTYVFETGSNLLWDGSAPTSGPSGIDWISLADYKSIYGITDTSEDAKLSLLITMSSAALNTYLDRTIKSTATTKVLRGSCTPYLNLGDWPVTSLTSVTFDYAGYTQETIDGEEFIVSDVGTLSFRPDSPFARFFDCKWVQVAYTAGYSVVPSDLQLACCYAVQQTALTSDPEALVTEKVVGNVKVKYASVFQAINIDPMFAQCRTILDANRALICL